jgi:hypothetical protein
MAILNIHQFIERTDHFIYLCPKCSGKMNETTITTSDAIKFIFGKKKIIKRYKCVDCNSEIKTEK